MSVPPLAVPSRIRPLRVDPAPVPRLRWSRLLGVLCASVWCAAWGPAAAAQTACGIGERWLVSESGWEGVWVNTGRTCEGGYVFDATWTYSDGRTVAWPALIVHVQPNGRDLYVHRPECWYSGRIQADGVTVRGTYGCSWAPGPLPWEATIECGGGTTPASTYSRTPNRVISGYNIGSYLYGSVDECRAACDANNDCESFDYRARDRACALNRASARTVRLTSTDEWDYYEKDR